MKIPNWRNADRGAVAVEFALVFPLIVGLTFGSIELGLATQEQTLAANAAREGARAASLGGSEADIDAAAQAALGTRTATITVTYGGPDDTSSASARGAIATVTVRFAHLGLTNVIPGMEHAQISASSSMRVER